MFTLSYYVKLTSRRNTILKQSFETISPGSDTFSIFQIAFKCLITEGNKETGSPHFFNSEKQGNSRIPGHFLSDLDIIFQV